MGEIDNSNHIDQNISFIPLTNQKLYTLRIISLSVENYIDKSQEVYSAIIDSGTTLTYLPQEVYEFVLKSFGEHCIGKKCGDFFEISGYGACFKFDNENDMNKAIESLWPKIIISIDGGYIFEWTPKNYAVNKSNIQKNVLVSCLGFAGTIFDKYILGTTWMKGYDIIFDMEKQLLGFAKAKCEKGIKETKVLIDQSIIEEKQNSTQDQESSNIPSNKTDESSNGSNDNDNDNDNDNIDDDDDDEYNIDKEITESNDNNKTAAAFLGLGIIILIIICIVLLIYCLKKNKDKHKPKIADHIELKEEKDMNNEGNAIEIEVSSKEGNVIQEKINNEPEKEKEKDNEISLTEGKVEIK